MGAILDLVEMAKTPVGFIVTIVLFAGIYYFVKWVMADDETDASEGSDDS